LAPNHKCNGTSDKEMRKRVCEIRAKESNCCLKGKNVWIKKFEIW
jgi:hypothetical protein